MDTGPPEGWGWIHVLTAASFGQDSDAGAAIRPGAVTEGLGRSLSVLLGRASEQQ
jgi:hypothetical protein